MYTNAWHRDSVGKHCSYTTEISFIRRWDSVGWSLYCLCHYCIGKQLAMGVFKLLQKPVSYLISSGIPHCHEAGDNTLKFGKRMGSRQCCFAQRGDQDDERRRGWPTSRWHWWGLYIWPYPRRGWLGPQEQQAGRVSTEGKDWWSITNWSVTLCVQRKPESIPSACSICFTAGCKRVK